MRVLRLLPRIGPSLHVFAGQAWMTGPTPGHDDGEALSRFLAGLGPAIHVFAAQQRLRA
jgi:hypothetical protein